jgi:hypothetical protein
VSASPAPPDPPRAGPRLPIYAGIALWMAFWVGAPVLAHRAVHGVVNGWHVALAFFLAINLLVCLWEISLCFRIGDIERWFHEPRETSGRPRGLVYTMRASWREFFDTHTWARVWLGYARYDTGYADRRSFGFAIDVGNGFSTLLPSLFFLVGMTFPVAPPVVVGLVGAFVFYQKLYGTALYFFQYLFNRRYQGHRLANVIAVVGGTNGIWLVFPAVGLAVCIRIVLDDSLAVLWR